MQIYYGIPETPLTGESTITIGVFDGVHFGHQALIARAAQRARESEWLCGVLAFDPHPAEVLAPQTEIRHLTTVAERAQLISRLGVDFLCVIAFTLETSRMSARDFVRPLVDRLKMRHLVIGHDFALGHKRQGDENYLRALGGEWGFQVEAVDAVQADGGTVSSTRIRRLLSEGRIAEVNRLLGHPCMAVGVLNADLSLTTEPKRLLPADGLYPCVVKTTDGRVLQCRAHIDAGVIRLSADEPLPTGNIVLEFTGERAANYEEIEHTADVALRVRAPTLPDLLCHAARGMFALMADLSQVNPASEHALEAAGADPETLLVNWLSELLYLSETTRQVFSEFEVNFIAPERVRGVARGGPVREIRKQIKAVTFHDLRIEQRDGQFETTVVFDI